MNNGPTGGFAGGPALGNMIGSWMLMAAGTAELTGFTALLGGETGGESGGFGTGRFSNGAGSGVAAISTCMKLSRGAGSGGDIRLLISHVFLDSEPIVGVADLARSSCTVFVGVGRKWAVEVEELGQY